MTPLAHRYVEGDVHDAHALELHDAVAEVLAHPANLPVESLGEDDAEGPASQLLDLALAGHGVEDGHAASHATDEAACDGLVDRDDVLFLVVVPSPQDLVDDVPVVRQEDESFARLVEAADREDARGVANVVDDVVGLDACIGGADDAHGLVERQVHPLVVGRTDLLAIDAHGVPRSHLRTQLGNCAIDGDSPLREQLVGRTS